ncbi:BAR-domain-containing protein [Serendipita vermifera]|nr:BAR-domain-containing protein [Serendipita vermifera]
MAGGLRAKCVQSLALEPPQPYMAANSRTTMASKQLGKLRQWAGEKITSEKKTVATEEFKDMEVEVERRRLGLEMVYDSSQSYYRYLTKKKEGVDNEQKLLPIETLGRIMVTHGEEFGTESAYGHSLTALGKAHVKMASIQEQFADSFHSLFLTRIESALAEFAQYQALRKKLKSRRLAYDAAVSHSQKQFRKEKEKTDAEEEVTRARTRFEEISTDVQNQMEKIQDGELEQFRDLSRLLDMETKFVEGWLNALRDIKEDWPANSEVYRVQTSKARAPTHVMQSSITATPSDSNARPTVDYDSNESEDSESSRRNRPPHQRSTSVATATSQGRKSSMSNWATAAVPSFLRRERSGNFEALDGNDGGDEDKPIVAKDSAPTLTRSRSGRAAAPPPPRSRAQSSLSEPHSSSKHNSPKLPPRNLPGMEKELGAKVMRALHSFKGDEDELSIEPGDEITVISEPSETWWMGECKGKKGLFPVNYTEEMPKRPPLPARPSGLSTVARTGHSQPASPVQEFPIFRSRSNSANLGRHQSPSFDDEPFGDHHSALSPIAHSPDYRQVQHSDVDDHDDEHRLVNPPGSRGDTGSRNNGVGSSPGNVVRQLTRSFSGKKAPPPPPPTRKPTSTSTHKVTSSTSNSANASPFIRPTTPKWESSPKVKNERSLTDSKSPFDEAYGETDNHSFNSFSISNKCAHCQCDDFQQSLFKQDGYCNSCFHSHA